MSSAKVIWNSRSLGSDDEVFQESIGFISCLAANGCIQFCGLVWKRSVWLSSFADGGLFVAVAMRCAALGFAACARLKAAEVAHAGRLQPEIDRFRQRAAPARCRGDSEMSD